MALTRAEWEVVISFDELGEKAEVYISHPVYIRKLEKLVNKYPGTYKCTNVTRSSVDKSVTSVSFECPKNMIRFGIPPSEKQLQASLKALENAKNALRAGGR